jgi:hypothetical protein
LKKLYILLVFAITGVAATILIVAQAGATPTYAGTTGKACGYCHVNPAGGGKLTAAGQAFKANGYKLPTTTTTAAATTTTVAPTTTTTAPTTTTARITTTTAAPTGTTTTAAPTSTTTTSPAATTTTTVSTSSVVTFADISTSTPYWYAIDLLGRSGIVEGYQQLDGLAYFRPSDMLFRAQFTKMVVQALGIPVDESMKAPFDDLGPDLPNDLYPHQYVAAAYAAHIIEGLQPGIFSPYTDITRAQIISMTVRGIQSRFPNLLQTPPSGYSSALGDFSAEHAEYLRIAQYNHLLDGLQGYGSGWDPWASATRGEAAQMLAQLIQLKGTQPR